MGGWAGWRFRVQRLGFGGFWRDLEGLGFRAVGMWFRDVGWGNIWVILR